MVRHMRATVSDGMRSGSSLLDAFGAALPGVDQAVDHKMKPRRQHARSGAADPTVQPCCFPQPCNARLSHSAIAAQIAATEIEGVALH